jgi:hypothetical protein
VKHKEEPMDEYKSRLSSYLQSVVREELGKYDGGFTDEMNDQREKNAEVLGYKLSGTSDVKEELLDENILKQIQQAEKIAKSMAGNMTGAVKGIEKIRRGLSRHKRVKVALKKYNESIDETKERDYKAEYKKYGSSTKAKKYRAELNQYNRKKGTYGNGDGKDASHKGGKIVGFEKESKNRGRAEKSRLKKESAINEETYFDPKGEFKKYMDKTFKRAGIKVLKFNPMKQSFHNGAWGGFYTVKSNHIGQMGATQKSDVLPIYINRVGEIELGIKAGGFHIGKAGSSQVLKNLKDFKKSDLDESYKTLTEGIKARMGEIAKQGEWEVYDPQTDKTIKVVKNSGAATRLMNRLMNSGQYEEIASRHVETHKKKFENISVTEKKGVSGSVFTIDTAKKTTELMTKVLKKVSPDIQSGQIYHSSLGGADRVSIVGKFSLDPKKTWSNNILENSRFVTFYLENDGTLEVNVNGYPSSMRGKVKMRKSANNDIKQVLSRMVTHFSMLNKKYPEGN